MRKSIIAIAFIFLGLNTLNAEEKPQLPLRRHCWNKTKEIF